jgi:hypothetical protein
MMVLVLGWVEFHVVRLWWLRRRIAKRVLSMIVTGIVLFWGIID